MLLKRCILCGRRKPLTDFYQITIHNKFKGCKSCYRLKHISNGIKEAIRLGKLPVTTRKVRKDKKEERILKVIRSRNKNTDVTLRDIVCPCRCPYTGLKLDYRDLSQGRKVRAPNLASVDRINPKHGYIRGNIQVISWLANQLKRDFTVEQLVAFAIGVLRTHKPDKLIKD